MPNREPLHGDGGETRQFATFQVGELFFGIEAVRVQEVIRSQEMTEIPLAPAAIKGLINLRGQIVAAVDTRCTLGLPLADAEKQPMTRSAMCWRCRSIPLPPCPTMCPRRSAI
jgi:chemotaxis signal transduction protein